MTFRAKPVVKRSHRPSWESQDRRNLYLNIGFGIVVATAVIVLLIAAGLAWYNEHLLPVGSVNGRSITTDEFKDRYNIESRRLEEAERRIRTATVAGKLTEAQTTAQLQAIQTQRQKLSATALERIIDQDLQASQAPEEGVTVSPEEIDARLLVEATVAEMRHAWVIAVAPETTAGATEPTADQTAAAKAKADAALKDLEGGKTWEDVAKTASTDATAPQAGDLGWIQADDTQEDEAFLTAVFAAEANAPTGVIEGDDGTFRIGRATEIVPATVDPDYQAKLQNDGIDLAKYRAVVAGDVLRQKLEEKIVADASKPAPQRRVAELFIKEPDPNTPVTDAAIKVRHILYSPKDDPQSAADLPDTDPAWAAAKAEADAAYAKLKADPSLFDSMARANSDETSATGPTGTGGKLPYFDADSQIDEAFKAAILKDGLKPGELLEPVKSSFGWHVIQVMYGPTDSDEMDALKVKADAGADFGALARDYSDAPDASKGGDIGWLAKGQFDELATAAVFAADIGKTSSVVDAAGDGLYLFKVFEEATRTPEGRQLEAIKAKAFDDWYSKKKAAATITRDPSIVAASS
jgi:parvulin-like peptidyl-prolyl isomerase